MDEGGKTLESMSQAVWYNRWTLDKFNKYLSGDILEVGCGIGNFSENLSKYGNLTSIDIDEDYLKKAKGKNSNVGFGDIEKGNYFFGKKTFNTIVCMNVLEHIQDDQKAINNIFKLLKKDGVLILLVPANKFLYNQIDRSIGHFRRYEKNQLLQMLNNFQIVKISKLNFLGAIGWFFAGKLFKDRKVSKFKIMLFNLLSPLLLLENFIEPPVGTSLLVIAQKK